MTLQDIETSVVSCIRASAPSGLRRIFLFGSRATRSHKNPRADIDIGILADHPLPFGQMARLREVIEEIPTLLKIDVVDFTGRNDEFTKEATQCMRVLYEGPKSNQATA